MAEFVAGLNPNEPNYDDKVRESAGHIRGIKKALVQTFVGYDEELDIGPIALNSYEPRIAALEASFASVAARKIESGRIKTAGAKQGGNVSSYTVTGLPFQPSQLLISTQNSEGALGVTGPGVSVGFADGTLTHCVSTVTDQQQRANFDLADFSSALLWNVYTGGAELAATGVLVSFNTDGFTVREDTGLNNITLIWTAFE